MLCQECGRENKAGAKFCGSCGTFLDWSRDSEQSESPPEQTEASESSAYDASVSAHDSDESGAETRGERAPHLVVSPSRPSSAEKKSGTAGGATQGTSAVTASLSSKSLKAEVDAEATCEVRVRNKGTVVDQYLLRVEGPAATWASIEPESLNVYPQTEGEVATITFNPPRSPEVPAGRTPFKIRVVSSEDSSVSAVAGGTIEVGSYQDLSAELVPLTSTGRRSASHELKVVNSGNVPFVASLAATDPDNRLRLALASDHVNLGPGTDTVVRMRARSTRTLWKGPEERAPFKVEIQPEGLAPIKIDAQFVQKAWLPAWLPKAAIVLIPLLLASIAFAAMTATVPRVDGVPQAAAVERIEDAGFVAREFPETDEKVPAGMIIRTEPEANARKRKGSTVKAFYSVGPELIQLPNVIGQEVAAATAQLQGVGFVVHPVEEPNETYPPGRVHNMNPAPNTQVTQGSDVEILISSGPDPMADESLEENFGGGSRPIQRVPPPPPPPDPHPFPPTLSPSPTTPTPSRSPTTLPSDAPRPSLTPTPTPSPTR